MSQQSQSPHSVGPPSPPPFNATSLYVGDLDGSVSEAQLYEIFSQIGPVVSIRVCRDLITRRSLGYAYVNFNSSQDASRALEALNYSNVNGRPMRIMFSQRDPALRKSGTGNIFIKNLDKTIDHKELYDTFAAFGTILSCKVATDANGQSKGYGFVQYEAEESAQTAIEKVNGMLIKDRQVFVGPFVRRQERDPNAGTQKFNNVYVKNLEDSLTEEQLKDLFGEYGPITSVAIMKDAEGKSRGFGFVNFDNADDAMKAVDELNGKKLGEKELYAGRALKKSEREEELRNKYERERKEKMERLQGVNLYLKNLDDTVDDDKIRELFGEFGTITSCKIMRDEQGQTKGAGFVAFSSPEEATRAVTEMNGKMVNEKPIYVALAQRKEERKQRLQAHFQQRGPGPHSMGSPQHNGGVPMYHQGMGQQMYFGQPPPPGMFSPQGQPYGYQPPVLGMRPGGGPSMAAYYGPQPIQRPSGGGQRMPQRGARAPFQGGPGPRYNRGSGPRGQLAPHGHGVPNLGETSTVETSIGPLASAIASAPPEQRRMILGEHLYPLVDSLEHEHAGKVTGMLLEMDQSEVLHLIESPEALKGKVQEAVDILRMANSADKMAGLSLSET